MTTSDDRTPEDFSSQKELRNFNYMVARDEVAAKVQAIAWDNARVDEQQRLSNFLAGVTAALVAAALINANRLDGRLLSKAPIASFIVLLAAVLLAIFGIAMTGLLLWLGTERKHNAHLVSTALLKSQFRYAEKLFSADLAPYELFTMSDLSHLSESDKVKADKFGAKQKRFSKYVDRVLVAQLIMIGLAYLGIVIWAFPAPR